MSTRCRWVASRPEIDVVANVAALLKGERVEGRVGLCGMDTISAKHMTALSAATPQIQWEACDDLVMDVRVIKSPAELDVFRYAGETVSNAMNVLFEAIFSGRSHAEAAGEAAREVYRRQGNVNFITLGHGPFLEERLTDTPIVGYSTETPQTGDLVRGWIYGAMYQGYWLDPGRTSVVGLKPTAEQRRLVEGCAGVVEQLRAAIRPGVRVHDVAALGQRLLNEFNHGEPYDMGWIPFGHGNGLYFEPPIIAADYDGKHQVILENMVGATEAFINVPGVGGAGFEQNFIVTRHGTELLTTTPMLWW